MLEKSLLAFTVVASIAGLTGCSNDEKMVMEQGDAMASMDQSLVNKKIAGWSEDSKKAATTMMQKYGEPDGMTPNMLTWNDKGPWKQIIISREAIPHEFPMMHKDVLEQVIDYKVPPEKFDELAMYDGSVIVERTKGTMSARCDKEAANFLALNLAHDIITEKKTVDEARDFYAKTVAASMKGEMHPYMQKLQFQPMRGTTMDPDKSAMER